MLPAPKLHRRVPPEEFLTSPDYLLMQREFDTRDPEGLPGLVEELPAGAAVHNIHYRYDVTPKGGMRNLHLRPYIHCAHCKGAHHWRGFVIELTDGTMALLGKNCGEDQFGMDFRRVATDFHAALGLQSDLRRVIEVRAMLPACEAELDALRRAGAMPAFDAYMAGLRRLGRLAVALQRIVEQQDGVLACTSYRRDREAEARRAETLPAAKHYLEKIAGAQTEFTRRQRLEEYRHWVDSQPPIEYKTVEPIGRMTGGGIFVMAPGGMVKSMAVARQVLGAAIELFMCSHSDDWHDKIRLRQGIGALRQGVDLVHRAVEMLAELGRFAEPENLTLISAWSRREVECPQPRIGRAVKASGRILIDEEQQNTVALPPTWAVPATPSLDALRVLAGD
jgi:hypothetical protein